MVYVCGQIYLVRLYSIHEQLELNPGKGRKRNGRRFKEAGTHVAVPCPKCGHKNWDSIQYIKYANQERAYKGHACGRCDHKYMPYIDPGIGGRQTLRVSDMTHICSCRYCRI